MSLSDTYENRALVWMLTAGAVTRPAEWYFGLSSTDPGEGGAGTPPDDPSYARVAVTFAVAGNEGSNEATVEFPEATVDQGVLTHGIIFDALTGGNAIAYGPLRNAAGDVAPVTVNAGQIVRIPSGAFVVTAD